MKGDKAVMTAHVSKSDVHSKPSPDFVDTLKTGYWSAVYQPVDLVKSFEQDKVLPGLERGQNHDIEDFFVESDNFLTEN